MGDFLDYFKDKKNLASLLVLGIIILGLPIGIKLLKQQQVIRSWAQVSDPIQFVKSDTLLESGGKWTTTDPHITFNIFSPLGPPAGVSPTPRATATPSPTPGGGAPTATPVPTVTPTQTVGSESFTISLRKGWNLISIPRPLANTNTSILAGVDIIDKIYYSNPSAAGGWDAAFRSGVNWSGSINTLEPGKGYWVNAVQDGQWVLSLRKPNPNDQTQPGYSISSGWNMIGYTNYKSNDPMPLRDYLSKIGAGEWTIIYRWNPTKGEFEGANVSSDIGFNTVESSRGYWVRIGSGANDSSVKMVPPER